VLARADAYRRLESVHVAGSHHRTDIALRASRGEVVIPRSTEVVARSGDVQ
jgi:phosphoribosylamine---glycine ligase